MRHAPITQETSASRLYASGIFRKFKETGGDYAPAPRPPLVEKNPVSEGILSAFGRALQDPFTMAPGASFRVPRYEYEISDDVLGHLSALPYSQRDIDSFFAYLSGYDAQGFIGSIPPTSAEWEFKYRVGLFIDALVSCGESDSYSLLLNILPYRLSPGIGNRKKVEIFGDVANVGLKMSGGSIIVHGNALFSVGDMMEGGLICVLGKGGYPGCRMTGGTIAILNDSIRVGENNRMQPGRPEDAMWGGLVFIAGDITHGGVGEGLRGGEIVVGGSVKGPVAKHAYGGRIEVFGDVRGHVGGNMHGGQVIIHGDVRNVRTRCSAGDHMEGGLIAVQGMVEGPVGNKKSEGAAIIIGAR